MLAQIGVKAVGVVGSIAGEVKELGKNLSEVKNLPKAGPIASLFGMNPFAGAIAAQYQLHGAATGGPTEPLPELEEIDLASIREMRLTEEVTEVKIKARRIERTADEEYFAQLNDLTKTSTERQISAYNEAMAALRTLRDEGVITGEQFGKRQSEALDELLPEIDISEIQKLYKPIRTATTELGEFMKGVWQSTGASIRGLLSDAIYNAKLSFKSLVDVARRAVADILSALVTSGIKKALADQLAGTGSGFWADLGKSLVGKAGGGRFDGPTIVGEDGPELVTGSGHVFNRRQMAFAGGGGVNFAPVTNISIIERENPEQTKREIFEAVAVENARQQSEFVRTLQRSGVDVRQ